MARRPKKAGKTTGTESEKPSHDETRVDDLATSDDAPPRRVTRAEFGTRVRRLMQRRGWSQSELGRRSGLPRDSISTYVRGAVFPSRHNLEKLAKALGVEPDELLPNVFLGEITSRPATFEMRQIEGDNHRVWLKIDQVVTFQAALEIASILKNDRPFASN